MGYSFLVSVLASLVLASLVHADVSDYLGKKYTLTESDNKFEDALKALGVGWFTRNAAKLTRPTISLTKTGGRPGYYTLKTVSTFKNYDTTFKPGEEFDNETADGREVKITITFDGNKMIEKQKNKSDGKILNVVREFGPDKMTAKMSVGDIVSDRIYKLDE